MEHLCKMGHPGYKFYDDYKTYEQRCLVEDPMGSKLVFPDAEVEIEYLEVYITKLTDKEKDQAGSNLMIQELEMEESQNEVKEIEERETEEK